MNPILRTGSLLLLSACLLMTCTTSPLNRRQMLIFSEAEMAQQGEQTYRQLQQELPISADSRETQYIQCMADYVVAALEPAERGNYVWEVTVFDDEQANAFALPGGKIGVYNGLLDVAVTQHQMASVIAHEVGHVLANHSNERASQAALRNVGLAAAQILGASSSTIEAIDVGSRYGIFLPFNRTQESEADAIGVLLMARAGFDPEASIILWQNMMATGGPSPPQLLSTHPSPASRMNELRELMEPALATRIAANSRGINPDCAVPENNLQF
ncbi:MAG: M48 family metallopeptidase [Proteobacteria bacterium]|nr:M48 family metallopeptidase [Pseudomonadota bacterium]